MSRSPIISDNPGCPISRVLCEQWGFSQRMWGQKGAFPNIPHVYVIRTPHSRLPASRPDFHRFLFALWLFYHFPARLPTQFLSAICRQSNIAPRHFSEFSELSTVFR